eukprot:CAMPEP_0119031038 /NCGR_PEP_ID=MMETSP1176-20130426/41337_1 /TAXON_ID=265551 /ORGANISM="Synedropsis recta cf, Strain CCMP1620" /LENGTH=439 /DNA_ID=CAMNT_0006987421 /DNA_START=112 /DNA_END=1428 /DNA_ORIENTATION=-
MQFDFNSDYATLPPTPPLEFPPADPYPCARITTRIYHPSRDEISTVQNVLVRTMMPKRSMSSANTNTSVEDMDDSSSSSEESFMTADDDDDDDDDGDLQPPASAAADGGNSTDEPERAYWMQRTIREAIYGRVLYAVVLTKRNGAEWVVTDEQCAIKEMSWQHIRKERDRLAEDPIKEVASMQFLKRWHDSRQTNGGAAAADGEDDVVVGDSFSAMSATNIMMPMDLLSDDRHLYSVMPFCDGGELFERLDMEEKFPEPEARYWMVQVLNGLENLQNAGICHRDMSLENLLVHKSGCLIIDMGMCLRVPTQEATAGISESLNNMSLGNGDGTPPCNPYSIEGRKEKRHLLEPQGTCGKWIYMSPEIHKNKDAFDGYAVDVWAAGVILFLMLTGFPPWERACGTDERFKYMTAGYLVQMLTEWELGLSSDAMDLLQRMMW